MSEQLDGATLKQGDTYVITIAISEGEIPWVGSAIAPGTVVRFYAKPALTVPDASAPIRKSSANSSQVRVLAKNLVEVQIDPADTRTLAFPAGQDTIPLFFEVQVANSTRVDTFRLESGNTIGKLYIQRDVIQSAP
jgi:hypothetical protein